MNRDEIVEWIKEWINTDENLLLVQENDHSKTNDYIQIVPFKNGQDPYHGCVHYEVIKRGEEWFAEFHVELYKSQGREKLETELNKVLKDKDKDFSRVIYSVSYSANRYWKCRCPMRKQEELKNDLALLKNLVDNSKILTSNSSISKESREHQVGIKTMLLSELLKENFCIPDYQRGYCWRIEDIRRMISEIHNWQKDNSTGCYNIGTVVLKEEANDYTIIDGQQRLTTFSLLARLKGNKVGEFSLGANNKQKESIGYLVRAKNTLQTLDKNIYLNKILINVVLISATNQSDDLAYLFFNHTNSLGKRLTDYELLKGHHLRFIDTEKESIDSSQIASNTVDIWNRLRQPLMLANNEKLLAKGEEELLHKILFRLRNWTDSEKFSPCADELPTHDLFRHFTIDYRSCEDIASSNRNVDYNSIVQDGSEFFNYVEFYRSKFSQYLQLPAVGLLYKYLRGYSNDVLFNIINALGFLFYIKFGEQYLHEALYCISYRVSEIRNKSRVMQKYISETEISGVSKWAMPKILCSRINRTSHESVLFPMLIDSTNDYKLPDEPTPIMRSYWESLKLLSKELKEKMVINLVKNCVKSFEGSK